jgi:hypothetical protein
MPAPPLSRFSLSIFADYFQFYIEDDGAPLAEVDFSDAWTKETVERQIVATRRAIGVGTSRNMTVPIVIEIAATCPDDDPAAELVTEASFEVTSGRLVILGCTDYAPSATRIEVVPGRHRARVFYYDLEKLSEDGLEGDDSYRIVLWPDSEVIAPRILVDRRQRLPSQRAR